MESKSRRIAKETHATIEACCWSSHRTTWTIWALQTAAVSNASMLRGVSKDSADAKEALENSDRKHL